MRHAIGIDLGGSRIKGVAVDENGGLLQQVYMPTNDGNDVVWKNAVAETVKQLQQKLNGSTVIGISAPGLPDQANTTIRFMPGRLEGLENFIWTDFLKSKAYVLNDGIAALVAEAKTGAAKDSTNAILVTLGTGVGGALLINKQPYQGSFSKAGHIGHMVINDTGDCDVTGMPGSLEESVGNYSVKKRSEGKFATTQELLKACKSGDEFAKKVWLTSVKKLAIGLASASNFISPDTIIVGGGIAEADDELFVPLNKWFDEFEWQPGGSRPKIVKAVHGDMAGAIGAACFALSQNHS